MRSAATCKICAPKPGLAPKIARNARWSNTRSRVGMIAQALVLEGVPLSSACSPPITPRGVVPITVSFPSMMRVICSSPSTTTKNCSTGWPSRWTTSPSSIGSSWLLAAIQASSSSGRPWKIGSSRQLIISPR